MGNQYSAEQSQEMLNHLVENDKGTYVNLEYARAFIDRVKADTGVDLLWHENKYRTLAERYTKRQNELKNSNLVKAQDWLDDKMAFARKWWSAISISQGLGALPVIPVAVGAIGTVVVGFALWQLFSPHYSDSEQDLKISRELKSALDKVSPETQKKIIDDLENQIDKAYKAGQSSGAIQQLINVLKYGAIAGVSIYLFLKFFPLLNDQVKSTAKQLKA